MSVRLATHAGSWYPARLSSLDVKLTKYLAEAPPSVAGARVLIGPHAGYSYCGSVLAETYKSWDTSKVGTVFIFSPSHYVYFEGAKVSKFDFYETPYGKIPVNTRITKELTSSYPKDFKYMDSDTDEREHGLEMHMPMLHKITKDLPQGVPSIVPILISHLDEAFEQKIGSIISQYISDEQNTFIVSSDFCHWGARFDYTVYTPDESVKTLKELDFSVSEKTLKVPIYKSIEFLDRGAMNVAATGSYLGWRNYIKKTGNTICGQKPLAIMLVALQKFQKEKGLKEPIGFSWIGYKQSNPATSLDDSSVSYASGYAVV